MIEAWFNERGYVIRGQRGESKFVYDLPPSVVDNAMKLYTARWVVLNQLLGTIQEQLGESEGQDLVLHTDSRLVEELEGDLTPDTQFAKESLRYFIENDYCKFRRVSCMKATPATIDNKLSEPLNQT